MKRHKWKWFQPLLCCCVGLMFESDTFAQNLPEQPKSPPDQTAPFAFSTDSLSFKDKYDYYLKSAFSIESLLRASAGASINQGRDYPAEWGQGIDGYGRRLSSLYGQHLIRSTVQFGVGAMLHEDPRHYRSERTGAWARTQDAIKGTFIVRTDSGNQTLAVGRIAGALSAGLISRAWYPESERSWGSCFERAGTSLGVDVGFNILREFWPDLKHRLRKH